jgi:phage host-nuclease inhibitor protein Gam
MSMSLYHIDRAILELVDMDTGEIMDYEAFEQLQMERETKLENIALWIKNLTAEAKAIREEEKSLADRRKVCENKTDRLKQYLAEALDGEKFTTAKCAVTFRKTSSVEITDTQAAAEWLEDNGYNDLVQYQMPKIGKPELAKILKAGTEIPGCELVNGMSMGVK